MQTKLALYLNEIFKYVILFLLSFVWINFYYPNFLASVIISIIIASIISYGLSFILYKKQSKIKETAKDRENIKKHSLQLIFNDQQDNLQLFSQVFKEKNTPLKQTTHSLILHPNSEEKILFLPAFSVNELDESIIVNAYKECKTINAKKCMICATKFKNGVRIFANSLQGVSFTLYSEDDVYHNLLKPNNIYPEHKVTITQNKKLNLQMFLMLLINKKNAKHYFYGGFITFIISFVIRLNTYYVVFSTIMFMLALLSLNSNKIKFIQPNKHIK